MSAVEHPLHRCQRRLFLSQRDLNRGMTVCWLAEPIPHTELPPQGGGSPFPWGRFGPQCDANPNGQEPAACAAHAQDAARAAVPPPARLIYAAPHFLLVSMPFSPPLPPCFLFVFLFSFPWCCLCIASLLYFHDSLLLTGLRYLSYLELPACVCSKWGFILPEEVTIVPITPLGCDHCVVRGLFLSAQGINHTSPLWMLQALGCSRPGRVAAGTHHLHPNVAAGHSAGHLSPSVWRRAAGCLPQQRGLCLKKGEEEKKFHFRFVCPHFICINLTFCCLFLPPVPSPLPCQAHPKVCWVSSVCVRGCRIILLAAWNGASAGGGCWGASSFISLSQPPPLCFYQSPVGCTIGVTLLFYIYFLCISYFFPLFFPTSFFCSRKG